MEISFSPGRITAKHTVNGMAAAKDVELNDVISAFKTNTSVDLGLLPPGSRSGVIFGDTRIIPVELPGGKRDLKTNKYSDGSRVETVVKNVSVPGSLYIFVIRKTGAVWNILAAFAFALENDRIILMTDKLYHLPLPNVYLTDKPHEICWGNDNRYDLKSPAGIEGMIRTFWTAPFNTDLFGTACTNDQFPWNKLKSHLHIDKYFELLAGEDHFKTSWLKPALPKYETLETALKNITNAYK